MKKLMFCFGTRPEAIKMAPVIKKAEEMGMKPIVCLTGQHREMIVSFLEFFDIQKDYDLDIMKTSQGLSHITASILTGMEAILEKERPDVVFVQGDTNTTFSSALASFYQKITVAHIEAGLRTNNKYSPFPEEINRRMTSELADFHFPPTSMAKDNLAREGLTDNVIVTGNTSIDALNMTLNRIDDEKMLEKFSFLKKRTGRMLLLTTHRRENLGKNQENIFQAVVDILEKYPDTHVVFPVHLNPVVQEAAKKYLGEHERVELIEPLGYQDFVWMMGQSHLILSDSGGVQEEAPHLGKPVLVLRDTTERPEGVEAGTSKLVGTDREEIVRVASELLSDDAAYAKVQNIQNPYGDGEASSKILDALIRS